MDLSTAAELAAAAMEGDGAAAMGEDGAAAMGGDGAAAMSTVLVLEKQKNSVSIRSN